MTPKTCKPYLKAVREIALSGEPITSQALVVSLKLQGTDRSTALDIAAGWICNLRRWGFLKILRGVKVPGPRRSLQVYEMTDWGRRFSGKRASRTLRKIAANPKKDGGDK
jgi:hypothetical protein